MKKWKLIGAFCLAAVLTAAGPTAHVNTAYAQSPEFARTAEEWARLRDNVMEYGELAGLVREYNVTVQKNQRDYEKNKNKASEDIAQDLRDQAESVRSSIPDGDDPISLASAAMAEAQASSLDQQADDNVNDSEILKMGYDQTESTLVSTAQSNMIAYHQKALELEQKVRDKELAEETLNVVSARMAAQSATQMDLLTAQEAVITAQSNILTAQSELDNIRQKLCVMLGWKYDSTPEIQEIPAADLNRISQMDPVADKEKALEQNYALRINKKKLANAGSNSTKDSIQLSIDDNIQKIGVALNSAYRNVQQAKLAYDQASMDLAMEARNMQTAELSYQVGNMSKHDYITQQYAYAAKQTAMKMADLSLFQAMENYDWAVNGLAET